MDSVLLIILLIPPLLNLNPYYSTTFYWEFILICHVQCYPHNNNSWFIIKFYKLILVLIIINLRFQFMLKCWELSPETRPTFSFIVRSLSKLLDGMAGYMDIDNLKGVQNIMDDSGNTSISNEPIS